MLIFGLRLTSDDQPPKSLKNEMFIFGLHSTSDDWPLCWGIYRCRVRLQDWLYSGDEFPIAFISELHIGRPFTGNGNFSFSL